jgi:threonine dehydrogenase-like Zn-dependent dehydrogenase
MKAIVWHGGRDMRLDTIPDPRPRRGQVLVRVEATAVCGSDLHLAEFGATPPVIPGHEAAGTVVECGEGVEGLRVGDHVALDPVQPCGTCRPCTSGIQHLCENVQHLGWGTCAGTWAELVAADAANAHRLPPGVGFTEASLVEPSAVCRHGLTRAGFEAGMSLLVMGDGPFGFLHAQWGKILGARTVIVAGHHDQKLRRIAAATGAVTCNTMHGDLARVVRDAAGTGGLDIAIEATGSGESPGLAIPLLKQRGTLVVFSYIWKPNALDMGAVHMRELNLVGSCRSMGVFPDCLLAMARKELDTGLLLDALLPMERFEEALDMMRSQRDQVFKVGLLPSARRA